VEAASGDRWSELSTERPLNNVQILQTAIRDTPVPEIKYGTFAFPVQHLIDHAVFTGTDPGKGFLRWQFCMYCGTQVHVQGSQPAQKCAG
jgi:hypothetical protein